MQEFTRLLLIHFPENAHSLSRFNHCPPLLTRSASQFSPNTLQDFRRSFPNNAGNCFATRNEECSQASRASASIWPNYRARGTSSLQKAIWLPPWMSRVVSAWAAHAAQGAQHLALCKRHSLTAQPLLQVCPEVCKERTAQEVNSCCPSQERAARSQRRKVQAPKPSPQLPPSARPLLGCVFQIRTRSIILKRKFSTARAPSCSWHRIGQRNWNNSQVRKICFPPQSFASPNTLPGERSRSPRGVGRLSSHVSLKHTPSTAASELGEGKIASF